LIVSGVYNFVARIKSPAFDPEYKGLYHALFGTKVLLALVIFFLASALTGRSEALAKIRQNAKFWLTVNAVLAVLVVCISGVLRFIPTQAV
jgi:arginine exporter protein ArgO